MSTAELRIQQRRGAIALAGRETRRVLSLWTQTILPAVVTATLFLAVFGGALGGRIRQIDGVPYITFILPGLLVMTVAGQAFANCATSIFQAKNEGYIEDVLSSPMRPRQLVFAYISGGLLRGLLAAIVVAALAAPFADETTQPTVAALALVLTGLLFACLGVITGIWAETFDQQAFIANIVITPLALLGGVFYSANTLGEPWSSLTRLDPLYYLVDATRAGLTPVQHAPTWISLALVAAAAFIALSIATTLLARGWRLKP
jgi:ABC-2 type transport system permease protein